MKNKKFTSILICCVVALWGIIFYRVYLAMDEKDKISIVSPPKKLAFFTAVNHINDSVHLNLNYRDPFSVANNMPPVEKEHLLPTKIAVQNMPAPKPLINWQAISYAGYISNANSKQKLVIVLKDGKEFMLGEGQSLNGIKLLKYAGDSIKVQYQGQSKYIKLR